MNGHSAKCEWLSLCKLGRNLNSPLRSVKQFGGALLWYAQLITLLFCKWIVMFLNDPLRHSLESVWQLCVCVRVCWWSVCRADCWPALQSSLMCVWVRAVSVCQPSTKTERKNGRTKKQNNQCVCVSVCLCVCQTVVCGFLSLLLAIITMETLVPNGLGSVFGYRCCPKLVLFFCWLKLHSQR